MCGVVGVVTESGSDAVESGVSALLRLEYRGYDSAGIATLSDSVIRVVKKQGGISDGLVPEMRSKQLSGDFLLQLRSLFSTHAGRHMAARPIRMRIRIRIVPGR